METCLGDRELLMHEMESLGNHGEELLQDLRFGGLASWVVIGREHLAATWTLDR